MELDFLLITATEMEQERVRARMAHAETVHCLGRPWHRGSLFGKTVLLIEAGVGQVNTAMALTLALTRHEPAVILQFGAGGAYTHTGLEIGDLAIATEECYGDTGVLTPEGWMDLKEMGFPLLPARTDLRSGLFKGPLYNRIPLDTVRVAAIQGLLKTGMKGERACEIAAGPFVTVQQCSGVQSVGDRLAARCAGLCENMEGAAAAHVAAANDFPFVEIRGISNHVVDRDMSRWDLSLAIRRCQHAVELIAESGIR